MKLLLPLELLIRPDAGAPVSEKIHVSSEEDLLMLKFCIPPAAGAVAELATAGPPAAGDDMFCRVYTSPREYLDARIRTDLANAAFPQADA